MVFIFEYFLCKPMWVQVHKHMETSRAQPLSQRFKTHLPSFVETRSLTGTSGWPIKLSWLALAYHLSGMGITSVLCHIQLFTWVSGLKLRPLCLCDCRWSAEPFLKNPNVVLTPKLFSEARQAKGRWVISNTCPHKYSSWSQKCGVLFWVTPSPTSMAPDSRSSKGAGHSQLDFIPNGRPPLQNHSFICELGDYQGFLLPVVTSFGFPGAGAHFCRDMANIFWASLRNPRSGLYLQIESHRKLLLAMEPMPVNIAHDRLRQEVLAEVGRLWVRGQPVMHSKIFFLDSTGPQRKEKKIPRKRNKEDP